MILRSTFGKIGDTDDCHLNLEEWGPGSFTIRYWYDILNNVTEKWEDVSSTKLIKTKFFYSRNRKLTRSSTAKPSSAPPAWQITALPWTPTSGTCSSYAPKARAKRSPSSPSTTTMRAGTLRRSLPIPAPRKRKPTTFTMASTGCTPFATQWAIRPTSSTTRKTGCSPAKSSGKSWIQPPRLIQGGNGLQNLSGDNSMPKCVITAGSSGRCLSRTLRTRDGKSPLLRKRFPEDVLKQLGICHSNDKIINSNSPLSFPVLNVKSRTLSTRLPSPEQLNYVFSPTRSRFPKTASV